MAGEAGHAERCVQLFWGEPYPPPAAEEVATNNQTLTDAAARYAAAIQAGDKAAQAKAAEDLRAWFARERLHLGHAEQGAAEPYAELYLRGVALVLKASADQGDGLHELAVEWTLAYRSFCRHCAVGFRVRSPGGRVSDPASQTRDDVYALISGAWRSVSRHGYDQARAMWAWLVQHDKALMAALRGAWEPEVRLLFPMQVRRYEHGVITWCPNLSTHPSGRGRPQAYGYPTWYTAHDESGRLVVVDFRHFYPDREDWRAKAKSWGGHSRLMPVEPPPPWPAMGSLLEAYVLGPDGRQEVGEGEPATPPPAPPAKPPKRERKPRPPKIDPAPAELGMVGPHDHKPLPGGNPRQCERCYHGERAHPTTKPVPARVPGDLGKQPPGKAEPKPKRAKVGRGRPPGRRNDKDGGRGW